MSLADVVELFKTKLKITPEQRRAQIERNAAEYVKRWREDCYVYIRSNDFVIYSCGPDLDHPKSTPTFIQPYHKKEKVKSVSV